MAKKSTKNTAQQSSTGHSWNRVSASQALMAARGFKPFDFLIRRCEELAELVVEIDTEARITPLSRQKLVSQAQLILGGNVISKKAAQGKNDVAWVQASWAHPEGAERLDPVSTFEVGVAVARNSRPYEECEKAARFLKFTEELPEGLSMLPDESGRHVLVPMLGIILKLNLVEIRRKGQVVGTSSIWHALIGFEERDRERFARPTKEERLEAEAENRRVIELQRAAEAKKERARKEQEELDALGDCFDEVWGEWEAEQEELKAARRSEQWKEFVAGSVTLRSLWETCKEASNVVHETDRELVEALQLVLRPTPAGKPDIKKALPQVRNHLLAIAPDQAMVRWSKLLGWVKDVPARKGLSLSESLAKANNDLPWLLPHWFVSVGGSVTPLYPLKELGAYGRDEWLERVALDPIISDETKEKLFSLAGEE